MKKNLILILVSTSVFFAGCSWFDKTPEAPKVLAPKPLGTITTPHPIEGLVVPSCKKLYAELSTKFPKDSADESYRAAAAILFSNSQEEDANTCCDNIKDETLKKTCKK